MPLRFERPSESYMRELRAVAGSAAALRDYFPKLNQLPDDFPQHQVIGFCEALVRLPDGTAEGSISPLRAADEGLNPIRQTHFHAISDDEKEPEFGLVRDGDLDLRLVSLMAAVRSAIERYKFESGEVLDTDMSPELPENLRIEQPRQQAKEAIANARIQIADTEKAFDEIIEPEVRATFDEEERIVKDTGTHIKSSEAVLATTTPRPTVLEWLDQGLQSTELALNNALKKSLPKAKAIGGATGKFAGEMAEIWAPKLYKSVNPVRQLLQKIRAILTEDVVGGGEREAGTFSYIETYNRLLRGEAIPASWTRLVTHLDFSFARPHHLNEDEIAKITGYPKQFSNTNLLANLTSLTNLNLASTNVADIAPLANLTSMTTLSLSNTQVADIAPLASLTSLRVLQLSETQVADIAPLANLTSLTDLSLDNTKVEHIAALANLTSLTGLSLTKTQVADITPLANLTSLRGLWLSNTQVADIGPLADLTNLTGLYLANTNVEDVSPLTNLTKIVELSLTNAPVKDIASLANLNNLNGLFIFGTSVQDITALTHLPKLKLFGPKQTSRS